MSAAGNSNNMSGIESWHEEKQSAWLYRQLAACEPDQRVAALFTAHWLEGGDVAAALGKAASSIYAVLETTRALGERELQLVAAQDRLIAQPLHFIAEKL